MVSVSWGAAWAMLAPSFLVARAQHRHWGFGEGVAVLDFFRLGWGLEALKTLRSTKKTDCLECWFGIWVCLVGTNIVVMFFFPMLRWLNLFWSQQHGATSFLLTVFETRIRSQHWKRLAFGSPGIYRKKKHGWAPNFQYNGRNGLQTSWGLGHQLSCWAGYHYGQGNGSGWKEMTESSRRLTTTSERKPWSMTSSLRWMCF